MLKDSAWEDVAYVAARMRGTDREEILATSFSDDPVEAVHKLAVIPHIGVTIWKDAPIVACGAVLTHPNVASMYLFATERWPEVVLETTRFGRKTLIPLLYRAGVHRLQAVSLATHTEAHDWMASFGAHIEGRMRNYGKNGEEFVVMVLNRKGMARFA